MRRHGLITGCVLVCLIVTVSLTASALRSTLRERREVMVRHQVLQTDWLLNAGIQLAAKQLADQPSYHGETWLPKETTGAYFDARVVIRVTQVEDQTKATSVEIIATLANSPSRGNRSNAFVTQCSHRLFIKRPTNP